MKKILLLFIIGLSIWTVSQGQPFNWTVTSDGIYRNGDFFYLKGQSWAKQTAFTYNSGTSNEAEVKQKLTELNAIGVNTLRIYGSPDESDWDGTSNFNNLIKWIEEWNLANPDGGDPNNAIYYLVQISPKDPSSSIASFLPENTTASFNSAIHDMSNPGSVASMVNQIDGITGGSDYLLGYLIYHEFNISSKYASWYSAIGASGIEDFMNDVADAIHNTYAPGKLVSHTGDVKSVTTDIYDEIENLNSSNGDVFSNFDLIGFNLYISTDGLLSEDEYYNRIVDHRSLSVNNGRGWYIGETGASYDLSANSSTVAAANYTSPQGIANLQIMWQKCEALGDMIGFMLFTAQDNDLGAAVSDAIKQRGHFDFYGDKKFLYYAYQDVIDEISTNDRYHSTSEHELGVLIEDGSSSYTVTFDFENKSSSSKDFYWSIHGDDGTSKQRFSSLEGEQYVTLPAGQSTTIVENVSGNGLFAVTATVIEDMNPSNSYLWGREHLLGDAIGTVAGLNLNTSNVPDRPSDPDNLSLSTSNVSFGSGSGSQNIDITSNVAWTVSDNASWITTSPTSGSDNGSFSINTTENTSSSSRNGTVTVSGGSLSETIAVVQNGVTSIPVTGVSLSPSTVSITEGETYQLSSTVSPTNASDQGLSYNSSNSSVATVSSNGLITAQAVGSATITVTTDDGGYTDISSITVEELPIGLTNLALNKTVTAANSTEAANPEPNLVDGDTGTRCSSNGFPQTLTVDLGAVYSISRTEVVCYNDRAYEFTIEAATISGGSTTTIVDRSSNTTPGTVASPITDNFSAVDARYVSITASGAASYTGTWVSFLEFRVFGTTGGETIPVTDVSVSPTIVNLVDGNTQQLSATISPSNATDHGVSWNSSNTAVATVNSNGLVTAQGVGSAIITVTSDDGGFTDTSSITVSSGTVDVTGVSVSPTNVTLDEGNTQQLSAIVTPFNASNQNVTWSTSNPSVAPVSSNGTVTAQSAGSATITVTTVDGDYTATSSITVEVASGGLTNLALNKSVTAANETEAANPEANLVDGNTGTRCSSNGFPQTLTVDLGAIYSISSTEVVCYNDRAYQFTIDASTTLGGNSTTIVNRSSNTTPGTISSPITDTFTAIDARYVSITATGAASYTGSWVSFLEFRVFGTDGGSGPIVPTAPSNLSASGITTDQIDISWADNSSNEDGFVIERSENGTSGWIQVASLAANTTNYSDLGLTASKTYYYRVVAHNSAGNSSYSTVASATTKSDTSTPITVTLNPSDDAYVRGGTSGDTNFGNDANLVVKQGSDASYFRKSYLKFDLTGEGISEVTSAAIRLYANSAVSYTITVYETTDGWDEGSATWNNVPSEVNSIDAVTVTSSGQYYEWDVTSFVQSELTGDGIVSLVVYDASATNQQIIFNSKEAGSNLPELVIDGTGSSSSRWFTMQKSDVVSELDELSIYPNPTSNTVYFNGLDQSYTNYSILDVSGSLIGNGSIESNSIQLKDFVNPQVVILNLHSQTKPTISQRIVVQ